MDALQQSKERTRAFSRVLGPFLVIADVTAIARASDMRSLLAQFEANSLWTWVAGAFVLVFGLVIVAGHQYWRGTAAIIVSLLGWLITLRGLLLLSFPQAFVSVAHSMIGAQGWWVAVCAASALVGSYLTYFGWVPSPSRPTSHAAEAGPDIRRIA